MGIKRVCPKTPSKYQKDRLPIWFLVWTVPYLPSWFGCWLGVRPTWVCFISMASLKRLPMSSWFPCETTNFHHKVSKEIAMSNWACLQACELLKTVGVLQLGPNKRTPCPISSLQPCQQAHLRAILVKERLSSATRQLRKESSVIVSSDADQDQNVFLGCQVAMTRSDSGCPIFPL